MIDWGENNNNIIKWSHDTSGFWRTELCWQSAAWHLAISNRTRGNQLPDTWQTAAWHVTISCRTRGNQLLEMWQSAAWHVIISCLTHGNQLPDTWQSALWHVEISCLTHRNQLFDTWKSGTANRESDKQTMRICWFKISCTLNYLSTDQLLRVVGSSILLIRKFNFSKTVKVMFTPSANG